MLNLALGNKIGVRIQGKWQLGTVVMIPADGKVTLRFRNGETRTFLTGVAELVSEARFAEVFSAQQEEARLEREQSNPQNGANRIPLILEVRRGTRVSERCKCSECRSWTSVLWRYSKSNRGEVLLCEKCKARAFDRSFGHVDASKLALPVGRFESSRKKH